MIKGKRVIFKERGKVIIEDFEMRELKDDEVLIKTVSSLISSGADYVLNPNKVNVLKTVRELCENDGADVVIEATGNPNPR